MNTEQSEVIKDFSLLLQNSIEDTEMFPNKLNNRRTYFTIDKVKSFDSFEKLPISLATPINHFNNKCMSIIDSEDISFLAYQVKNGVIEFFDYNHQKPLIPTINVLKNEKAIVVKLRRYFNEVYLLVTGENKNKTEIIQIEIQKSEVKVLSDYYIDDKNNDLFYDIDLFVVNSSMKAYFLITTKNSIICYNKNFKVEKIFPHHNNGQFPAIVFNYQGEAYIIIREEGELPKIINFNTNKLFATLDNDEGYFSFFFDEYAGILYLATSKSGDILKFDMNTKVLFNSSNDFRDTSMNSIGSLGTEMILVGGYKKIYLLDSTSFKVIKTHKLDKGFASFVGSAKIDGKYEIIALFSGGPSLEKLK